MQELLDKVGSRLEALLAPPALLQLAAVLVAVGMAWWIGRVMQSVMRERQALIRSGIHGRLLEALLVVSPHLSALVITAAFGGFLHALKAETRIIDVVITLAGLLLLIRLGVYVARLSFESRAPPKGWGNAVTLVIWAVVSLHVLGWFSAARPE